VREYQAIVTGVLTAGSRVDVPMGRHPAHRTRMAVVSNGRPAVTHYRVARRFRAHTLVRVTLETGRTHQVRVHMAHIGHPLVGDPVYGGPLRLPPACNPRLTELLRGFRRQALHAWRLTLHHPVSGQPLSWESPLPQDMSDLLDALATDLTEGARNV
jgi:23S rRNA pseudouridine1911/1915/1917 synthase